MKKVYQTIVDKDHGNCMQAVVASLFEKELGEVPNFIEFGKDWCIKFMDYFWDLGYEPTNIYRYMTLTKKNEEERYSYEKMKKIVEYDGGIDGYFYATVPSQTFDDRTHAVVVNKELNVVHDPNPNQEALELESDDILSVLTVTDFVIVDNKIMKTEEYENREVG